jgi:hypothetical protein
VCKDFYNNFRYTYITNTKQIMKNISVKFAGVFAVLAFAVTVATPASAQTAAELQAMIAQLQAQIAAMSGGSTAPVASTTFTRDLTLGSTGADVVALQTWLESKGFLTIPAGTSKGYFGELTRAALAKYQMSVGISPAAGYFGPMTRAKISATGGTTTPGTTTPGSLSGEGDLEFDITLDGDINIDLGDSDDVIEVELEAVDGDVQVERVDFYFDVRPWLYFDEVALVVDGKEVASLSRESDFSEDGSDYRARFSGLNLVIDEDETSDVTLRLTVLDSMQGDRDEETVDVWMDENDSIRFVDGSGAVLFAGVDAAADVTFTDEFGQGGVSVTLGDDSPEDAVIVLDEDARTNGVTVLEFEVEAEDSDIEVQDISVEFDTNASSTSATLYRAYLYSGSTLLKSKAVTGDVVTFDDIEFAVDEDDTEMFTVKVDFNKTDGITVDEFTVVDVDVVYENSDYEEDNEGLTVNETHQLVVEGLVEEFDTKSSKTTNLGQNKTNAIFTFEFELTAYEADFYIDEDASDFDISLDTASTSVVAKTIASTNATLTSDDSYRINKGQTRTFKVEVEVQAVTGAGSRSVRATINDLDYYADADMGDLAGTLTFGAPDYRSTAVTVFDTNN